MKHSLFSAAAGLIAGAFTLMLAYAPVELGRRRLAEWPSYFIIAILYGAPFVFTVWLFVLWPLYARVPTESILWHPLLCLPAGAIAGTALYFVLLRLILRYPSEAVFSGGHLFAGAMAGVITCAVALYFKRHDQLRKIT